MSKLFIFLSLYLVLRINSVFIALDHRQALESKNYFSFLTQNNSAVISKEQRVVAFYNVYAEGPYYRAIVEDQMRKLKASGLMAKLDQLYYATMGNEGNDFVLPGDKEKISHIVHYGNSGVESQTQSILYDYCALYPDSKVLYFHNKGSFHMSDTNNKFRFYLDCFVLTPHCIEALDTHDTCGWRISPVPTPHYSGNFWWATCQHINRLLHPMSGVRNETFITSTKALSSCIGDVGRYFAEQWVGSYPDFRPADCMSAAVDTGYIYAYYNFPGNANQFCPAPDGKIGQPCATAASFVDITAFKGAISYMADLGMKFFRCGDMYDEIVKRSYLWYGQPPVTYMKWMAPLRICPNFTEGELVRPVHSKQVYLFKEGAMRPINDVKTFFAMGLDFDNVHAYDDIITAVCPQRPL